MVCKGSRVVHDCRVVVANGQSVEDAWVYEDSRAAGANVLTKEDAKNWEDNWVVEANGLTEKDTLCIDMEACSVARDGLFDRERVALMTHIRFQLQGLEESSRRMLRRWMYEVACWGDWEELSGGEVITRWLSSRPVEFVRTYSWSMWRQAAYPAQERLRRSFYAAGKEYMDCSVCTSTPRKMTTPSPTVARTAGLKRRCRQRFAHSCLREPVLCLGRFIVGFTLDGPPRPGPGLCVAQVEGSLRSLLLLARAGLGLVFRAGGAHHGNPSRPSPHM